MIFQIIAPRLFLIFGYVIISIVMETTEQFLVAADLGHCFAGKGLVWLNN